MSVLEWNPRAWCSKAIVCRIQLILSVPSYFPLRYDKREDLMPGHPDVRSYTHLLMEVNSTKMAQLRHTHRAVSYTQGYSRTQLSLLQFPPVSIMLENKVVLMERIQNPGRTG